MIDPKRCPACDGNQHHRLEKIDLEQQHQKYAPHAPEICQRLTEKARETASSYQMFGCASCGLEFAWPMRSPNSDWYGIAYQTLKLYPDSRWEFHACLKEFRDSDEVFEFGCGSGAFLELCARQTIPATGSDFLVAAVDECLRKGFRALPLEISKPLPEKVRNTASQIVAFHVLEHLEQPQLLFEQAALVAKADAKLWIAVPSCRRATRQKCLVDFLDQHSRFS